jgi:hypothetical protein
MENFDLRKYLAEGKLLKEDMASKAVSVLKSYKGEVKGLEDYIKYLMNTSDDISSSIQAVADDMDRDNDAEDSLRRDLEKLSLSEGKLLKEEQMGSYRKFLKVVKSYEDEEILSDFLDSYPKGQDISKSEYDKFTEKHLGLADPEDHRGENWKYIMSEGKLLKENTNPIWTIEASEDDADISDAGLEYIRAVGTIIDKALPDMSIEDMIASMEVINNFWYDEARKNAKGSEPEEIKVSAIDFADSVIEHYEDVLMDKDIKENKITNNKMNNFDLRKYLAEGRLYENTDEEIKVILTKSYPGAYSEGDFKEIINLYNTKYRDYKDSYGKLDGVEQAAFKFNYANNRDIETGMKAGSKSSTSIDFPEMEDEFEGAMSSMSISKEEYLQDIIDASADEIVSDSYFEIKNAVEQEIYSKNEAVKLAKEWARKKLSTLAEGKLFEEVNPIWVIDAFEDSADIEQAGPAYKKAVIDIIKSKHPDISDKDLEASIEVMNVTWYNEARSNAKGSEPEEMKVSAEEFADGAIEHYEDVIVFDNNNRDSNIDDDFDKRLNALIKDSRHPTRNLKYFSERHRNKFRNYAEKFLKPINASDSQIRSALFKYTIEYYDTKDI